MAVAVTDSSATEGASPGDPAKFQISRNSIDNNNDLTVDFSLEGTATLYDDYTVTGATVSAPYFFTTIPHGSSSVDITINPVNDTLAEGPKTLRLSLKDSNPAAPDYVIGGSGFADITITDNDQPTVTISSTTTDGGYPTCAEGAATGKWVVKRVPPTGGNLSQPLTVFLDLTGSATFAADYTLDSNLSFSEPGHVAEVVIPANASSTTVTLTALQDSRTEGNETATLSLHGHTDYQIGAASAATITITDDDSIKLPANGYAISLLSGTFSAAYALNNNFPPSAAGNYIASTGYAHAFRKTGVLFYDLGVLYQFPGPTQDYTYAYGVNDSNDVVGSGFSYTSGGNPDYRPYYFVKTSGGTMTPLSVPGSVDLYQAGPMAINNAGWIAGFTRSGFGAYRAAFWDTGGNWADLGSLGSLQTAVAYAWAINQGTGGNRIAGQSQFDLQITTGTTTSYHAFRTQSDIMKTQPGPQPIEASDDLGNALASETSSSGAYAINTLGEVAGYSAFNATENRAAYKDASSGKHQGWRILGVLSGSAGAGNTSQALGINDVGVIVGWSRTTTSGSPHAVAWENYQAPMATDLNTKIPTADQYHWVLQYAEAVNNGGYIVGYGTYDGATRAFLLTPNP